MIRRIIIVIAVLALSACMLTGCGKDKKDDSNKATADTSTQTATVETTESKSDQTATQKATTANNEKSGDSSTSAASKEKQAGENVK